MIFMFKTTRRIAIVTGVQLAAAACAAEREPTMATVTQTFRMNQAAFEASVGALQTSTDINFSERTELRAGDAVDPRIDDLFQLRPLPVKIIIVYPVRDERLSVDYVIYAAGLSVSGRSWKLTYGDVAPAADDPAVQRYSSCDNVNLADEFERPELLIAECALAENWTLAYSK